MMNWNTARMLNEMSHKPPEGSLSAFAHQHQWLCDCRHRTSLMTDSCKVKNRSLSSSRENVSQWHTILCYMAESQGTTHECYFSIWIMDRRPSLVILKWTKCQTCCSGLTHDQHQVYFCMFLFPWFPLFSPIKVAYKKTQTYEAMCSNESMYISYVCLNPCGSTCPDLYNHIYICKWM